jgi:hypothetical protein
VSENDWQSRVDAFWSAFDDSDPERMLAEMRALVDERGAGDPLALAEWGGVHDSLGLEADAVAPYRSALAAGLPPGRHTR